MPSAVREVNHLLQRIFSTLPEGAQRNDFILKTPTGRELRQLMLLSNKFRNQGDLISRITGNADAMILITL